jgi:hypothetical protein
VHEANGFWLEHSLILRGIGQLRTARCFVNPASYLRPAPRPYISKELPGTTVENLYCLRCNRELQPGHKSVAVYMFAQTVGVRPRQKSAAQRICFCPPCSVSLAMGPPPEGAFNVAAWKMIREVVSADPALTAAAWETLRGVAGLLSGSSADRPLRPTGSGYFEF